MLLYVQSVRSFHSAVTVRGAATIVRVPASLVNNHPLFTFDAAPGTPFFLLWLFRSRNENQNTGKLLGYKQYLLAPSLLD